jgi:hypothetical protein
MLSQETALLCGPSAVQGASSSMPTYPAATRHPGAPLAGANVRTRTWSRQHPRVTCASDPQRRRRGVAANRGAAVVAPIRTARITVARASEEDDPLAGLDLDELMPDLLDETDLTAVQTHAGAIFEPQGCVASLHRRPTLWG